MGNGTMDFSDVQVPPGAVRLTVSEERALHELVNTTVVDGRTDVDEAEEAS